MRLNPDLASFRCSETGHDVPAAADRGPVGLCACCPPPGKPLLAIYRPAALAAGAALAAAPAAGGLWRFAPVLPVLEPPAGFADDVGGTPVVRCDALGGEHGVELWLKLEGGNPTGSFKDRGLAVGVALGALLGARRFCVPTQGNAGVAACLFSARVGVAPCLVYMPEAWRGSPYHRACELFGGEVRFAGANVAEAGRAMRLALAGALAAGEVVDLSTFFEPGRLEGKKTMGLEIVADLGAAAWPDVVVYPTGGGTGLVGIWKAFQELLQGGAIDPADRPLPRLVAVQSANCAPVVEAFRQHLDHVAPVTSRGTVADGLDVPAAIMGHGILAALRASGGSAVAVSEQAIGRAFRRCGRAGLAASYESAATVAALELLRQRGDVAEGARVLLLFTAGHQAALARTAAT